MNFRLQLYTQIIKIVFAIVVILLVIRKFPFFKSKDTKYIIQNKKVKYTIFVNYCVLI